MVYLFIYLVTVTFTCFAQTFPESIIESTIVKHDVEKSRYSGTTCKLILNVTVAEIEFVGYDL